ncbi:serine/threonine-protein kinase [Streptomyces sp. NPDC056910]|uniref:serine/threonine-protein kinase n=1 Tax=Streptomyces sp. NPDC056910 TaxID=3345964 RepID=UPI0036B36082
MVIVQDEGASVVSSRVQPLQQGDPRSLGRYRVLGRLGSGGMGTVYAALGPSGERLAIKVVHPAYAENTEFRARFRREVQLSRRVAGPCLAAVHDAEVDAPAPWFATAFVPGPTLDQHVTDSGPMAGARLYALAAGTAAALSAIHEAGVVHRDIKPQNIILAPSGPVVLDFGIAHALDGTSVTRTGVMTGTPGWISPEHYRAGAVGPHGDIFAWGALIAYASTGRLPFGTGAADAVAFRVLSAEPDLDGVPDDLQPLTARALSKDPSDRPTAAELAQENSRFLAAQATAVISPGSQHPPTLISDLVGLAWDMPSVEDAPWPVPSQRGHRIRLYLAVAATAAVLGSVGGVLTAAQSPSDTTQKPSPAPAQTKTASGQAQHSPTRKVGATPHTPDAAAATHGSPSPSSPSPAYTRTDTLQPTIEEWAAARVPATQAEKATAQRLTTGAAPVLRETTNLDGAVTITFNPAAQTMFVTFGPGIYPEGQDYHDDPEYTDAIRGLMFGSCSEAQQDFHDDTTWPYGRTAIVYRESMASPLIADFRDVTHIDSCRV